MSLFYFSNGSTMNIIVPLDEIEIAGVPLTSAPFLPDNGTGRWKDVFRVLSQAIATGGKIIITVEAEPGMSSWRSPLADAPEPYRERTLRALGPFASRFSLDPLTLDVELVC